MTTIELFDEITAQSVTAVAEQLRAPGPIRVQINSAGGSVFAGLAVYNLLAARREDVSVEILGIAASIASVIACAGSSVTIRSGAWVMLHKPWSAGNAGDAEELRRAAELLDRVENSIVSIYQERTGIDAGQIRSMMSEETWLDAEQAVAQGFADRVESGRMVAMCDISRFQNVPLALINQFGEGNLPETNDAAMAAQDQPTIAKAEVEKMIQAALQANLDRPEGRKTKPTGATSAPAIIAKGMRRDSDPLNVGSYFRGCISGNWKNAPREREVFNSMSTTGDGAGIVPSLVSSEVWYALLGRLAITESGARVITLPNGTYDVPTESTSPSASWLAEGESMSDAGGEFDKANLAPHKIGALIEITNELLRDAPELADQVVRQAMLNALTRTLNAGFLTGTGSDNQPTGIFTATGLEGGDQSEAALTPDLLITAFHTVAGAGGSRENIKAIMSAGAAIALDSYRENDGQTSEGGYLYSSTPGSIASMGRVVTDAAPFTAGSPDTADVIVGDFAEGVSVYQFGSMEYATDPFGAFERDSTRLRVTMRVDIGIRQPSLLYRLDNVAVS